MTDKPILIYSDHCEFSQNFIKILVQYPDLFNSFIRVNIDIQPNTKSRPKVFYQLQESLNTKITKVPTVITVNGKILSDKDAFKWLENTIKEITQHQLSGFEISSLSDNYSEFGSTDICDSKSKNYGIFDKEGIDDNYLKTSKGWDPSQNGKTNGFLNELEKMSDSDFTTKQSERLSFDTNRQQNQQQNYQPQQQNQQPQQQNQQPHQQQNYQPQNQQRKNVDFTNPNFGMGGQLNQSLNISQKQKDTDSRLEKLMLEREETNNILNQRQQY